jgi:hypothetical protein
VHQRQLRGNLPQAFVHAAMLECAVTLSRDVRLGGDRGRPAGPAGPARSAGSAGPAGSAV